VRRSLEKSERRKRSPQERGLEGLGGMSIRKDGPAKKGCRQKGKALPGIATPYNFWMERRGMTPV